MLHARPGSRSARPASTRWLVVALLLAGCGSPEPVRRWPAEALRAGGELPVAELAAAETHRYRLPLEGDRFLRLAVDQQGVDVQLTLTDPDGATLVEADRLIGAIGPELVLAVTAQAGDHLLAVASLEGTHGPYRVRIEALRPASAADRRNAEAYRRLTAAKLLPPDRETRSQDFEAALATWRELGETALAAEALDELAKHHRWNRRREQATALSREAAAEFARAGDLRRAAIARLDVASDLVEAGEPEAVVEQVSLALPSIREDGDRLNQARAEHFLGRAARRLGRLQAALEHYQRALELWPPDQARFRAQTLHELGVLHARFLHDRAGGRELLIEARESWPPGTRSSTSTLNQLGRLAFEEGRLSEARESFQATLELAPDPSCRRGLALTRLALIDDAEGDRSVADARLAEAAPQLAAEGCVLDRPTACLLTADLATTRGEPAAARDGYRRCGALFAGLGDEAGSAESLAGIARAERTLGHPGPALAATRRALGILEGVRPTVLREDLRTSYFSATRELFDLEIELLLASGAEAEAWAVAEQARARALRDLLAESGAGLRRRADPEPVERERSLQARLNALESRRLKATDPEPYDAIVREIDSTVAELQATRAEIRRRSPAYAALTRTGPPSPTALQELLDDDTVLLEYRLGAEASTVWAVTRESIRAVPLPPRAEIERLAGRAAAWQRKLGWPGTNPEPVCALREALLSPVAGSLGRRRLAVVADGALETVSFAALPDPTAAGPCADAQPLVAGHEIAVLPSAATLADQRRLLAGRPAADGWLAVLADPVYGPDDERLADAGREPGGGPGAADGAGGGPGELRRLPRTAEEARAILDLVPAARRLSATGFEASRRTVESGALAGFRIVHIAAHGELDPDRPLLSRLVLSRFDERGRRVEGALAAHRIYDLELPAELVVLSACDTGGGRQVAGEGLVAGLPRAFLYAGAARVLVSLWAVPDDDTRELMTLFYRGLIELRLPPAEALGQAQRELWRAGRPPYAWAGFVLLGDWRPLPPFSG